MASATLAKCAFLCTVLAENADYYHLAFRVGMFGLELARPPATTKPLEVKLAHQECELVTLLKRIPLGPSELEILREKAEQLRDGVLRCRGDALLPLSLATFIFEALVISGSSVAAAAAVSPVLPCRLSSMSAPLDSVPRIGAAAAAFYHHHQQQQHHHRLLSDEILGFEAAVAASGLKANVSEADHPLLCEGTRRQRGDLVVMLLVHYKDDPDKLARIMEKLLDREVHPLYKAPLLSTFYTNNPTPMGHNSAGGSHSGYRSHHQLQQRQHRRDVEAGVASMALQELESSPSGTTGVAAAAPAARPPGRGRGSLSQCSPTWEEDYANWQAGQGAQYEVSAGVSGGDGRSAAANYEVGASGSVVAAARSHRLAHKPHRHHHHHHHHPGSDSGSSGSGKSSGSDSLCSRAPPPAHHLGATGGGGGASAAGHNLESDSRSCSGALARTSSSTIAPSTISTTTTTTRTLTTSIPEGSGGSSSGGGGGSSNINQRNVCASSGSGVGGVKAAASRFKGKRLYPSVPNQASEASAHFMFELAKTALTKAGGNSSTSLFTQPINSQNPRGPHRALHMCAFQIGLYALGLHNCVSAKWLSRTYSSHVSWITGQAMEIGSQALWFLISTWEGHLTPPEVASIADRASRGHEPNMERAAAELALSCLPHAHALNPNEIQRAILQCKEQSSEMLERACLAVESAAKGGGVYPEVLFCVARCWHELYEQHTPQLRRGHRTTCSVDQPPPPMQQPPPTAMQHHQQQQQQQQQQTPAQNMAGIGVPVPYPMASIVPFPLAYSFLSGTAPGPNPGPARLSGVPVYLPAPNAVGGPASGPNSTFSYAPPIPGLQYFSSMPMGGQPGAVGVSACPPNAPPGPSPLISIAPSNGVGGSGVGGANGNNSGGGVSSMRPPPPIGGPPGCPVTLQPMLHPGTGLQAPPAIFVQAQQQQQHQIPSVVVRSPSAGGGGASTGAISNQALTPAQLNYLLAAYRVGIVALETLGRRAHDDRPQARYSRNPPYGEDVKWLLSVAKKLGTYLFNRLLKEVSTT